MKLRNNIKAGIRAGAAGLLICGLSCGSAAGITSAFLTSSEQSENLAGFAENTVLIREPDFPDHPTTGIGITTFPKRVYAENTGTIPVYIRVRLVFSDPAAEAASKLTNSTGTFPASELASHLPDGWVSGEAQGLGPFFYYTKPVDPTGTTTDLIQSVTTEFTGTTGQTDYDIYVRCESIQTLQAEAPGKEVTPCTYDAAWKASGI